MREIKFRAWCDCRGYLNKHDFVMGLWCEVYDLETRGEGTELGFVQQDITLEQYTGLKDKNGVEIYEGDILSSGKVVEFSDYVDCEGYMDDVHLGWKCAGTLPDVIASGHTVTGNIHENPELLERLK